MFLGHMTNASLASKDSFADQFFQRQELYPIERSTHSFENELETICSQLPDKGAFCRRLSCNPQKSTKGKCPRSSGINMRLGIGVGINIGDFF